jgi:hypothetical protein
VYKRNEYKILLREPEGKIPLREPGPRWEDIINRMGGRRLDSCDRIGTSGRFLREHCNEPPGSLKCWKYLDSLSNCQLLKNDSSAFS